MKNIFVGNLSYDSTEESVRALFEPFGVVNSARIMTDRETGRSRGFGFAEMPDDAQGKAAIEALNGKEFGGRFLTVNEARPRAERGAPTPGAPAPRTSGYGNRNTGAGSREA